jgi:SAM-dependent methyltransferase
MFPTAIKSDNIISGLKLVPGTESRQYHSKIESIYALPADGQEYDRLDRLKAGAKVLDVGCGPGSWIKEVKKIFPTADCFATDFADTYKPSAEAVTFVHGDILKRLPFEDNTFDFVHMRFFTGALKLDEWPVAIKELQRITKPGGWIQQVEPDGTLRSEKAVTSVMHDWNKRGFRGSLQKRGGEPNAGLKLHEHMAAVGLTKIENKAASAPMSSQSGAVGAHMVKDYQALVTTLAPVLSQSWDMTAPEVVEWGAKVMAECEAVDGFHNFHTAIAQKPL